MNKHKALPWKDYTVEREEEKILALRDERYMGLVPSGGVVSCLWAGVGTQDDGFYYEIRAWGWGMNLESWQIRFGFVETFETVKEILVNHMYLDVEGKESFVRLAVQDAMGHRTADVYPGTTKPIPGGIRLLRRTVLFSRTNSPESSKSTPGTPGPGICARRLRRISPGRCAQSTRTIEDFGSAPRAGPITFGIALI